MVSGATAGGTRPKGAAMSGWFRLALGLLAVVVGALWTVQGLGHIEGSMLTGQRIWAVVGPVLVLLGLALLWLGVRARNRR
ncbi:hypothetical protein Vqi01_31960 [Micromonospora qiuiae]|uniref:Integral membrane protein n=1 Tax=Micromonospora qiuiae TaxID=502268 RepID=A0ABQ4JCY2_9ACTN|nr:hypothetical protein [Micromonospora qiuiae]GIJ28034.1 hypothetical protein Vqi01_31960 [Micromonospora qiuiae]